MSKTTDSGEYVPRPGCYGATSWGGGGRSKGESRYKVKCECGFLVVGLSTAEAAEDAYRWHKGLPSALGDAEREHFGSFEQEPHKP